MRFTNSIFVVDMHTAGYPVRIAVGGLPRIRGNSVAQKRDYMRSKMDYVRTLLCYEPRGHAGMYGALLTDSSNEDADFGVIFFSTTSYEDMCGHGIIGVATALIETGMISGEEPLTKLGLETPAGLIKVNARVLSGKVKSVSFVNVPAFLYKKDISINVPDYGEVKGDVAFGGNWFLYVTAQELGAKVVSEESDNLIKIGAAVKSEFNRQFDLVHPIDLNISRKLLGVCFVDKPRRNKDADQTSAVVGGVWLSREPSGTATSGRMAVLFSKNKLKLNDDFINESITGTTYKGKLVEKAVVGSYKAIVAEITGSAYVTGFNHIVLDPDDPFGSHGFLLGQKIL